MRHKGFPVTTEGKERGEGFSSHRTLAPPVRFVYCHACGAVSTNVFGERDICTKCGGRAEPIESRRPWQYYVSSAILLAAAAFFVWGPFEDLLVRVLLFLAVLMVSYALSTWGMNRTKQRVLKEIAQRKAREERA